MVDKKNYLKLLFGERGLSPITNYKKLNENTDFDFAVNETFLALAEDKGSVYYDVAELLAEPNPQEAVEKYLKENAEEIAENLLAIVLRYLRHPNRTSKIRPFLKDCYELTDADWYALEQDLKGRRLQDNECGDFAAKLEKGFDNLSAAEVDAVLAVRYGVQVDDKADLQVVNTYTAAMEKLKEAVK